MWAAVVVLFAAGGCNKKKPPAPAIATPKTDAPKTDAPKAEAPIAQTVLIGSVRLEPGHELPAYEPAQMERSVLAHVKGGTFPDVCTPPKKVDRQPVRLTPDGKLIGVMVALSEFSRQPKTHAPRSHEVTIKDCRLTPTLIVAQIGDMLHVKNEVNFPLLPGLGSEQFNQTLTQGQTRDLALDSGGVKLLMCGFTAPCGRTDVVVMGHPYAAATDEKGEFRIDGFPADETVRLNAWHPLFAETFINVRVTAGETKRVEIVLTPLPPPPPPPPPPDPKAPKVIAPE